MTDARKTSPRTPLLCLLVLNLAFSVSAGGLAKKPAETPDSANAFLDRFIGEWLGGGTFDGTTIMEELRVERVLDGTYLFMQHREVGGANFQADVYVGYDAGEGLYKLYAFNNYRGFGATLPSRLMTGQREGDTFVTEERPGRRPLRYTFEFLDEDTFRLTKAFVTGKNAETIVTEIFRRQPPE